MNAELLPTGISIAAPAGTPCFVTCHRWGPVLRIGLNGPLNSKLARGVELYLMENEDAERVVLVVSATAPVKPWARILAAVRADRDRFVSHVRVARGGALLLARACGRSYCEAGACWGAPVEVKRGQLAAWRASLGKLPLPADTRRRLRKGEIGVSEALSVGLVDALHGDEWDAVFDDANQP